LDRTIIFIYTETKTLYEHVNNDNRTFSINNKIGINNKMHMAI